MCQCGEGIQQRKKVAFSRHAIASSPLPSTRRSCRSSLAKQVVQQLGRVEQVLFVHTWYRVNKKHVEVSRENPNNVQYRVCAHHHRHEHQTIRQMPSLDAKAPEIDRAMRIFATPHVNDHKDHRGTQEHEAAPEKRDNDHRKETKGNTKHKIRCGASTFG